MPRREVPFLPNQYYHFYNRGNNRQAVFFERGNYAYFLKGMEKYLQGNVDILAYCLMPTHYHILVRVKPQTSEVFEQQAQTSEVFKTSEVSSQDVSAKVSRAMQKLLISYTKAINKRFDRVGALFQGQFQGKSVKNYKHLLALCAYIHGNPVKDGLANSPELWDFSNYADWLGLRGGGWADHDFIRENFGSAQAYADFLKNYLKTRHLDADFREFLGNLS
jgi:REP element-mobilizing transposase RayT